MSLRAPPLAVVVMGVSGAGKTTLGEALAESLGVAFVDADDYHPQGNVDKMARGVPLDDVDRKPWLERLNSVLARHLAADGAVLACSALKEAYRDELRAGHRDRVHFVYLKGSYELLRHRLERRTGHYMGPSLLESQFRALEEPSNAIVADAELPTDEQVAGVRAELGRRGLIEPED